jgi:hypothetical protein
MGAQQQHVQSAEKTESQQLSFSLDLLTFAFWGGSTVKF